MINKLLSKKFLAFLFTTFLTALGIGLGFAEETVGSIVGIGASFIFGQGLADFGERGRAVLSGLVSRKVWVYVLGTVLVAALEFLQIDPAISKWILALVSPYLIGEGIADAGAGKFLKRINVAVILAFFLLMI